MVRSRLNQPWRDDSEILWQCVCTVAWSQGASERNKEEVEVWKREERREDGKIASEYHGNSKKGISRSVKVSPVVKNMVNMAIRFLRIEMQQVMMMYVGAWWTRRRRENTDTVVTPRLCPLRDTREESCLIEAKTSQSKHCKTNHDAIENPEPQNGTRGQDRTMMLNAYRTFFKRIAASFTRPPGMANSIIHSSGDSEEPFARKPDQSRFDFSPVPYLSEEDQQGEGARKATRERTKGCTRSRLRIEDTIWERSKNLRRMKRKEKQNREKPIERNRSRTSIKSIKLMPSKRKDEPLTSRRPYCCYLVLCVA